MGNPAAHSNDDRRAERTAIGAPATLRSPDDAFDAVIVDLSVLGFQAETAHALALGQRVLPAAGGERLGGATVVWTHGDRYGFSFDRPISPASLANATRGSQVLHGHFRLDRPRAVRTAIPASGVAPGVGTGLGLIAIGGVTLVAGTCMALVAAPFVALRGGWRRIVR